MDPAFISELLGSVDADLNDPMIQATLSEMGIAKTGADTTSLAGGADSTSDAADSKVHFFCVLRLHICNTI